MDVAQHGGVIISPVTATWPARCVKCNVSVPSADYRAKITWYPRWTLFVFIVSRLIGLILMMVKRRTVLLNIGLCEVHRAARSQRVMIGGGLLLLGVLGFAAGIALESTGMLIGGPILLLVGIIVMAVSWSPVKVQKVEGEIAYLKADESFVNSLPYRF